MAAKDFFDLIVVGSGPGGYVAAARAAQLGMRVACIEKEARLGGVCLNAGCIPSKALLDSSEHYYFAVHRMAAHGIQIGRVDLDLPAMMERKDRVVSDLTQNVRKLLTGSGVAIFQGRARLTAADQVVIEPAADDGNSDTPRQVRGKAILLATGSRPASVPGLEFDGQRIVGSTEALCFDSVPVHLGIVGGGYIGLELGSVWLRLGARVTVVEMLPRIGAALDGQVARSLDRTLRRQGFDIRTGTRVTKAASSGGKVRVELAAGDQTDALEVNRLLVAVGRRPLTEGLGLAEIGVVVDPGTGQVPVDETFQTSVDGVYAIGDLVAGPMLAHKASAEAAAVVSGIAGGSVEVNYDAIPSVIYTWPEVAGIGLTEEHVKERRIPYQVGTFPFSGTGRARCMGDAEGFVKMIAHARTDRILGVHILGPRAADMIGECALAMEFGASAEDIGRTIHGHPTFAEALQEAALAVGRCSIYGC